MEPTKKENKEVVTEEVVTEESGNTTLQDRAKEAKIAVQLEKQERRNRVLSFIANQCKKEKCTIVARIGITQDGRLQGTPDVVALDLDE